jgi:hypothetical protein
VAKLIIYRGDALDREIELAECNARIGRGDQNDIVLADPGKSVSRFHAELRFEQGRFTIVDLNSQNGTWVGGRQVQQAALEPGVPVVLGTYRIVLKKEAPPPAPEETDATLVVETPAARAASTPVEPFAAPAPPPLTPSTAATVAGGTIPAELRALPGPASTRQAPVAAQVPEAVAPPPPEPAAEAAPVPAPPTAPPAAPPVKALPPKPAPAPPAPAPPKVDPPRPAAPIPPAAAKRAAAPARPKQGVSRWLMIGGFAIVVVGVMAAAVFLTPLKNQVPGLNGTPAPTPAESATPAASPVASPQDAPPQPADAPAPAPEVPPTPTAAAPAAEPEVSQPPAASRPVPPVETPAKPAGKPTAAAPPRGTTPAAPAARRGSPPPPAAKPLNVAQTIDEGRSAMAKGDYLAAIAAFEAVLKADPKHPNAGDLLATAKGGAKNASQLAVDAGNKAEMGGDYVTAAKQYDRALQLDPESPAAADAIRRMKARMQGEGEDAFKRARQYDALGRAKDAIPMYEKALQLLPPDHASVAVAKERLAALKGGF